MMRVLFLNPPDLSRQTYMKEIGRCGRRTVAGELWPQTGLAYLAAVVREAGKEVCIIDGMAENRAFEECLQSIRDFQPNVTVVNTSTPTFNNDIEVLARIKSAVNSVTVMVGTHPSALPVETVSHESVDYVIINEAEETIVELLEELEDGTPEISRFRQIKGIAFATTTNEIVITEPRPYIETLDRLPFPARDLLPNERYTMPFFGRHPFATVIPTRGCPWQCIFCRAGKVWGRKIRVRTPGNVVAEIKHIIDTQGIKHIVFMTDSLTLNTSWIMEFLDTIIEKHLKFHWICNSRVDAVNPKMLKKMKRAGCKLISYGIESGSQEILDRAQKKIRLEDSRDAIRMTRGAGILSMAYLILGLPGETEETILQTMSFIKGIEPDYINVHIATPFPGTAFYDMAKAHGWLVSDDWKDYEEEGCAVIRTEALSAEELVKAQREMMRGFYMRPKWILRELFRFRNHTSFISRIKAGLKVISTIIPT